MQVHRRVHRFFHLRVHRSVHRRKAGFIDNIKLEVNCKFSAVNFQSEVRIKLIVCRAGRRANIFRVNEREPSIAENFLHNISIWSKKQHGIHPPILY